MADQAAALTPGAAGALKVEQKIIENQLESSENGDDTIVKIEPEGEEKKEGEDANGPSAGQAYLRLWKEFGSLVDRLLQLCGLAAAIISGSAIPLMTLVLGSLVNNFNDWGKVDENGEPKVTPAQLRSAVNKNALYFVYLFIGKFVLVYTFTVCFTLSSHHIVQTIRVRYVKNILRQEIAYFDAVSAGSVATKVSTNVNLIQIGLGEKVGVTLQGLGMLLAAFAVAFSQSWKLTLVTLTSMPAIVIIVAITVMMDSKIEKQILEIVGKAGGLAEEALSTVRNVIAFGANDKLVAKYEGYMRQVQKLGVKKGPLLGIQYSTQFSIMYWAYALAFWYGVQLILRGEVGNGGKVVTVLFACMIATSALTNVAPSIGEITQASAAAKDLFETIDRVPKIDSTDEDSGLKPEVVTGRIEFRNITFHYPARPTVKVLDNLDLVCEENKTTALVGASGSGKSTVIALAERWYDPDAGEVLFGGHKVKDLNLKHMRMKIGLVQQEPVLFEDTVYANVVFGLLGTPMADLPEEELRKLVQKACEEANCHQFIEALPEGYDTNVGERAGLLSGGQRQRIAISRSIIANPPVLLLDEATSALDPKSEAIVQAALNNAARSRTTIMVSHRLSTVRKADKIVVLDKGHIIETGSHEELMEAQGAYFRLVRAQTLAGNASENSKELGVFSSDSENGEGDLPDAHEAQLLELKKSTTKFSAQDPEPYTEKEYPTIPLYKVLLTIAKDHTKYWYWWTSGIIGSIAGGAIFPVQAFLFSRIVTVFGLPPARMKNRGAFWALIYFFLGLYTLITFGFLAVSWVTVAFLMSREYRTEYFAALISQDVAYYDLAENSSGAMTSRLTSDPQHVHGLLQNNVGLIVIVLTNMFSSIILAFAVGWKLACVTVFVVLPLVFSAGVYRMKLEFTAFERSSKWFLEATALAAEAVSAIRTVSSLTMEDKAVERYRMKLKGPIKKAYRGTLKTMIFFGLSESVEFLVYALAFWYGGKLLSNGEYDGRQFFLVFTAIVFGGQSAGVLFGFGGNLTKAHSAASHIIQTNARKPPISSSTGLPFPPSHSDPSTPFIEFSHINFNYPTRPSVQVLRNFNLSIKHGETIGICGASGCGKSTLIALLERFYDTTSGEILINSVPLPSLDVREYRAKISLVSQEPTLYSGTIRENILLGLPASSSSASSSSDEAVIAAAEAANIHSFIQSLPDGYDTEVGSKGLALSGGQRQRLAIARALIRDPEILLLDEATSALDTESEKIVQKAIEKASQGRTVVAIAHRLSTIKNMDRIVVVEKGRVVEQGTHEELIARRGMYWGMCQGQGMDREVV